MSDVPRWVQGVGVVWGLMVVAAWALSDLAHAAGRMQGAWVGVGMAGGFGFVAVLGVAAMQLPSTWPLLVRRLVLLVGMGGALWSTGQLTRALYAWVG